MERSVHSSSNANSDAGAPNLFMATLQKEFIARAVARASRFRLDPRSQSEGSFPDPLLSEN